jgi:hypothetical protein
MRRPTHLLQIRVLRILPKGFPEVPGPVGQSHEIIALAHDALTFTNGNAASNASVSFLDHQLLNAKLGKPRA